jgi:arylsulfatase A-like enzyme
VGEILDVLREQRLLEKTIVVFTSDHGDLCGEHGRLNKGVPYEGSARIPFLMYCPDKIPAKTIVDEALSCIDVLPTTMSMLGISVDHPVDGRDASSLFAGSSADWEDIAFIRSTSGRTSWISAVNADFKLVFSSVDDPWLIDLKNDPLEIENQFANSAHRDLIRSMTEKLRAYGRENHDSHLRNPRIRESIERVLR